MSDIHPEAKKINLDQYANGEGIFLKNPINVSGVYDQIGNEEFVLYNSRSLYYGNLNLIYMEFEKFSKDNFYYEIIANLNPKYLVLIDNEKKNEFLNNCKLDLIYKSKIKSKINRKNVFFGKNFEKNRISSIKIYEFNNKNAKFCINR